MNGEKWNLDKSPKEIKDIIPKDFIINSVNKKLKWENIIDIRLNLQNLTQKQLSKKYDISVGGIKNILNNKTWKPEYYPPHIKSLLESQQQSNNSALNQQINKSHIQDK